MLDLLIIQHESDTPPGTALTWANERGLKSHIWNIATEPAAFKPEEVKALLICGGSMDTFEEDKFPWLKTEKAYIKSCIDLKKPIMGLCLGSQLLAELLGGKVYAYGKWEIGFVPVTMFDKEQPYTLNVFHWHQCTFELPPGAKLLGTNEFCANQAFTFGDNIVATQFHPETTKAWVEECSDSLTDTHHGLVQTKKEMLDSISLQEPLQVWFHQTLDKWYQV